MTEREPLGGDERATHNTSPEATAAIVMDKIAKRGLHQVQKNTSRLKKLDVEYVAIDAIRPNTYNPNRQDAETLELLCRSIAEDGFTQPIIVHRQSGEIVDGEHRWRAARKMEMTQIPVVYVDMTEEQMRIATLRHNRARGSEDIALSVEVLRDLQELGAGAWAQESLMMSDTEMNALLDEIPAPEALAAEEHSEAWVPERGDARQGDVAGDEHASTRVVETKQEVGSFAVAMTKDAAAKVIERKQQLQAATTDLERTEVAASFEQPFRLQMVFTGEEAKLVREALGEEPAECLLDICKTLDPGA